MSGQSYLDAVEKKTGITPRELVQRANAAGFTATTKTGETLTWFKNDFALGHGHAMAMTRVVKHYDNVDVKNADTTPEPPSSIGRTWLDGVVTRPW